MKRALIATLYNEADNVVRWWGSLMQQTVLPDEIVIVDGGSTDGTWEKLQALAQAAPLLVKLEQRRCNIAAGRNRAIELTDAEIIASNDSGCTVEPEWFGAITQPLLTNPAVDVVGGQSITRFENEFQKFVEQFEVPSPVPTKSEEVCPSSRNIAFRRQAWQAVGGYPEWLTLTAEDALFNFSLHKIGKQFVHCPDAKVYWPIRPTAEAYFKMYYSYGYGAAEAQLYTRNYLRNWAITLCPLLLLMSRHRFKHLSFRYRKNAASARGWLAGKLHGHRPPAGWQLVDGLLLSPAALQSRPQS